MWTSHAVPAPSVAVGPDTGEMETVADRIPADIRAALQPVQVKRLAEMLAPQPMEHGIDYRVSTTLFGQRFYLAVITGPELRTRRRLIRDGQHRSLKWLMFDFLLAYAAVSALLVSILLVTAVVAYLVKSGLGIDLFDGPSFLHQFFFD